MEGSDAGVHPEDTTLLDMGLSVRARNILRQFGFQVAWDMAQFSQDDLFDFVVQSYHGIGFGETTSKECAEALAALGLRFPEESAPWTRELPRGGRSIRPEEDRAILEAIAREFDLRRESRRAARQAGG
jgi:hypothetical protein